MSTVMFFQMGMPTIFYSFVSQTIICVWALKSHAPGEKLEPLDRGRKVFFLPQHLLFN